MPPTMMTHRVLTEIREVKAVREYRPKFDGEDSAGKTAAGGTERKGQHLGAHGVNAHEPGSVLVLTHGHPLTART